MDAESGRLDYHKCYGGKVECMGNFQGCVERLNIYEACVYPLIKLSRERIDVLKYTVMSDDDIR